MQEELLQFPEVSEMNEILNSAKADIKVAIEEDPEMAEHGKLILDVIGIIEEKVAGQKDLSKLSYKDKIFLASHVNFFQTLVEDMFMDDFDFDEEDLEEEEEEEEAEEDDK